jgi:hypothetical protein
MNNPLRPGWATSEFYVTAFSAVATLATLIWHKDFSGYVQAAALLASGIAGGWYSHSRTTLKKVASVGVQVPATPSV